MINKDVLLKFCDELKRRIAAKGHTIQSINLTGNAVHVDITLTVDNKQDFYVIYDDMGVNRWMRVYVEGMAK